MKLDVVPGAPKRGCPCQLCSSYWWGCWPQELAVQDAENGELELGFVNLLALSSVYPPFQETADRCVHMLYHIKCGSTLFELKV